MKRLRTISLVLLVLTLSSMASAQPISRRHSHVAPGKLSGFILSPDGAGVPGAQITITSKGVKREILSAGDGSYEINLPTGKYKVSVARQGFYSSKEGLSVIRSNVTTKLDVTLSAGEGCSLPRIDPN